MWLLQIVSRTESSLRLSKLPKSSSFEEPEISPLQITPKDPLLSPYISSHASRKWEIKRSQTFGPSARPSWSRGAPPAPRIQMNVASANQQSHAKDSKCLAARTFLARGVPPSLPQCMEARPPHQGRRRSKTKNNKTSSNVAFLAVLWNQAKPTDFNTGNYSYLPRIVTSSGPSNTQHSKVRT